jgi:hypothetical protein
MSTLGDIRLRVSKRAGAIDLDLLDGFIADRYVAILDAIKWSRQRVDYALTTEAAYSLGTVTLANGSAAVTLAGGAWTTEMSGRVLLICDVPEYYELTVTDAADGTLDRVFDGASGAYAYQLPRSVYALPPDARIVESCRLLDPPGPMKRMSRAEITASGINPRLVGPPSIWVPAMDSASDPPLQQVEFHPAPDQVRTVVVTYVMEAPSFSGTAASLLPWLRPAALVAGVTADALEAQENYNASDRQEARYKGYLADMIRTETLNRGPQALRQADWLTRHNVYRAMRGATNRTGPRMP